MSDDVEYRIESARLEAERERQTREFMQSLTKNDEIVRPVYNPEAFVLREKFKGMAARGEMRRTQCKHPIERLQQFEDSDPTVARRGKLLNLWQCGLCEMPLWLRDPFGADVGDA